MSLACALHALQQGTEVPVPVVELFGSSSFLIATPSPSKKLRVCLLLASLVVKTELSTGTSVCLPLPICETWQMPVGACTRGMQSMRHMPSHKKLEQMVLHAMKWQEDIQELALSSAFPKVNTIKKHKPDVGQKTSFPLPCGVTAANPGPSVLHLESSMVGKELRFLCFEIVVTLPYMKKVWDLLN